MARVVVNVGVVPFQRPGDEQDGIITIGKHAGKKLSDEEVTRGYLAWLLAWLESAEMPGYLQDRVDLVWYWGERKSEDVDAEYGQEFDELVDKMRMALDEELRAERPSSKGQQFSDEMTYHYDEEQDEWRAVTVYAKRRLEKRARDQRASRAVVEAVSG